MQVRSYADVAGFVARAESWLTRREAEHNLLLGLLPRLLSGEHGFEEPIYLATIEAGGAIAGCAFRTPPFKLGLTRMPLEAIELVDHVAGVYRELPAVLGREPGATRFAELWSRRAGGGFALGSRQRIHSLGRLIPPAAPPDGALRPGRSADLPLLVEWLESFARETGTDAGDPRSRAAELVRDAAIHVWGARSPARSRRRRREPPRRSRGLRLHASP